MKLRSGLVAIAIGATTYAALPASASTGYMTVLFGGSGSYTFAGFGEAVTDSFQGQIRCAWSGMGGNQGGFSGTCWVGSSAEPVAGSYTRVTGLVTISGNITGGPISGSFSGDCVWASSASIDTDTTTCHLAVH